MSQGDATKKLEGDIHFIRKANKSDTQQVITQSLLGSEDEFQSLYFTPRKNTNVVIEPPYNPLQLASLIHRNNILAQCVATMEVNIDGSGYTFEPLDKEKDKVTGDNISDTGEKDNVGQTQDDSPGGLPASQKPQDYESPKIQKVLKDDTEQVPVIDKELEMLEHFFNEPYPGMSFTTMRRKLRVDMESTGNGYLEVIRNLAGEVVFLRHLESVMMRLVKLDAPTDVEVTVTRGDKDFKAILPMRERRYAYKVGAHIVYYREFGSSRQVNKKTGAWIEKDTPDEKDITKLGSEVIHFTVTKDFRTHYGLPRWINQLPSVLGSRKAEEYNLEFFDAGGLPPAIIFIQGGALVGGVKEQLNHYLSGKASQKHRAAIVEVMSTSGSLDSAGSVSVKVERFGACCDSTTEILTNSGWVKFPDWNGEKVATIENGCLVYQTPLQYHVYDYDGFLHHIEGNATEFMVTPNHRVYYEYNGSYRLEAASNTIKRSNIRIPVSPSHGYGGDVIPTFNISGVDYSEGTFLDFLGMFIADGSTTSDVVNSEGDVTRKHYNTTFIVKKQRKKDFIYSFMPTIAKESKVTLTSNILQDAEYTSYTIYARELRLWLRENVGTHARNKRIPLIFLQLNKIQSERLLMALLQGDGHRNDEKGKDGWTYTTRSTQLANDIQTLCIHAGYRSVLSKVKNSEDYCLSITPKTFAHVTRDKCPKWESVYYTGKVYCFTMPTGLFVSRRNGKVCITGNSATDAMFNNYDIACNEHIRKSFRLPKVLVGDTDIANRSVTEAAIQAAENQVFQPERFHFDEVINTTIVKALGAKKYRFRSLSMNISDPQIQLNTLTAAGALIKGEDFVEVANELSGLKMKYSAEAEAANKQQGQPDMGGGMDGGMGDYQDYQDGQTNPPPGQGDPNELSQPPQGNQFKGYSPQQQYGDPNSAVEYGQAPPINYSGRY